MAEFVSMYRKDYLWPPPKSYFPRTDLSCNVAVPVVPESEKAATCLKSIPDGVAPLAPALEACPRAEIVESNETDTCLKKLLEKNPNLFNVIRKVPSLDGIKKFNLDRLRTTYQVDYDHICDPPVDFEGLPKKKIQCPMDEPEPPVIDCRPQIRSQAELLKLKFGRLSQPSKRCKAKSRCGFKRKPVFDESDKPAFLLKVMPAWSSEYRDGVGRSGVDIMRMMKVGPRKASLLQRRHELLHGGDETMTLG